MKHNHRKVGHLAKILLHKDVVKFIALGELVCNSGRFVGLIRDPQIAGSNNGDSATHWHVQPSARCSLALPGPCEMRGCMLQYCNMLLLFHDGHYTASLSVRKRGCFFVEFHYTFTTGQYVLTCIILTAGGATIAHRTSQQQSSHVFGLIDLL